MSSWKKYKLEDVVSFSQGFQISTDEQYSNCQDGMSRFIRIVDYTNPNEEPRYIKDISQKYWVNAKDVVMIRYGSNTAGKVVRGFSGYIANNMFKVNVCDENLLNKEFLYYFLSQSSIYEYLMSSQSSSTMPAIKFGDLYKLDIFIPSIETQINIVDYLNAINEKIELNTQINQTLEQIAQTIFKSWFIDFDPVRAKANALASGQTAEQATQAAMAVISGKNTQELHRLQTANPEQYQQLWEIAEAFPSGFSGYKNLGEIPIGWNVLTFKDFISESKEKVGSLEDVPEYSVGNEGIYPRSEKYNKSLSKTPEKNKVVRMGDLVFGMGSKTLNWGIMKNEIGSVSPAYFVYRMFNDVNYVYLNKYIKAKEHDFQQLIKPTSRQGQSVDREMFLKKEIYVPNDHLLNIYLNKLKEIESLVDSYVAEVLMLEQIRDELLPKLLSGEVVV